MPAVHPLPGGCLQGLSDGSERPKGEIKKLIEAARAWAHARCGLVDPSRSVQLDAEAARDFDALGVCIPDHLVSEPETFDVMRCNWKSVSSFLVLETQWRVIAGGQCLVWTGLDYPAAAAAFKGRSQRAWTRLLADLKSMEGAALPILNGDRTGGQP
ncbi:MAG: DUF1799 domain-containing protein [Roseibium sp.]